MIQRAQKKESSILYSWQSTPPHYKMYDLEKNYPEHVFLNDGTIILRKENYLRIL
jgi:hypothetical protein